MVDDTKRLDGNGLARVWTATQKLVADNINDGVPVNGVVEFDGLEADIPDGYTKIGTRDGRLLIKKGEKTIPVRSTVVNEETASDVDVYSCEYINDKLEDVENTFLGTIPQGDIVVNSIRSKNINSKPIIQGLYQVSDGIINRGYSGYVTLDGFLPINYGETITISNKNSLSGTYFILEYNASRQYLNAYQSSAGTTATFTISNANTTYVAIDFGKSGVTPTSIGDIQVELGETASTYSKYQELNPDNFKNEEIVVGSIRSKNMFDKNNVIVGYRFGSDGALLADSSYSASQYIKVKANTTYTISRTGTNGSSCVCLYQSNGTFISRTFLNTMTSYTFTTTQETAYIKVAELTNILGSFQLEEGSTATNYMPYQNLDNMENYSTGETVIGTWIDGKPLYRKTYKITNQNQSYGVANPSNVNEFIKLSVMQKDSDDAWIPSYYWNSEDYLRIFDTSGYIQIRTSKASNSFTHYIVVEYTKTTD